MVDVGAVARGRRDGGALTTDGERVDVDGAEEHRATDAGAPVDGDEAAGSDLTLDECAVDAESASGFGAAEKHIRVIHGVQSCGTFRVSPGGGTFGVSRSFQLQNVPHSGTIPT